PGPRIFSTIRFRLTESILDTDIAANHRVIDPCPSFRIKQNQAVRKYPDDSFLVPAVETAGRFPFPAALLRGSTQNKAQECLLCSSGRHLDRWHPVLTRFLCIAQDVSETTSSTDLSELQCAQGRPDQSASFKGVKKIQRGDTGQRRYRCGQPFPRKVLVSENSQCISVDP